MTFTAKQDQVKWTEKNIAGALATQAQGFARKYLCVVPNCSWTGNECDLLVVTENLRIIARHITIITEMLMGVAPVGGFGAGKAPIKGLEVGGVGYLMLPRASQVMSEASRLVQPAATSFSLQAKYRTCLLLPLIEPLLLRFTVFISSCSSNSAFAVACTFISSCSVVHFVCVPVEIDNSYA